jgi:hypothetical protein
MIQLAGGIDRVPLAAPGIRSGDALALWAAGIADALVAAVPAIGRRITLSGGNDWLTYEWHARDIALHGLWMNHRAPLGHGLAFFQQPLYPYLLAA